MLLSPPCSAPPYTQPPFLCHLSPLKYPAMTDAGQFSSLPPSQCIKLAPLRWKVLYSPFLPSSIFSSLTLALYNNQGPAHIRRDRHWRSIQTIKSSNFQIHRLSPPQHFSSVSPESHTPNSATTGRRHVLWSDCRPQTATTGQSLSETLS